MLTPTMLITTMLTPTMLKPTITTLMLPVTSSNNTFYSKNRSDLGQIITH
jgi:hypothetical protein